MPNSKSILISGSGVAGPALALFLVRNGHICTIVERTPSLRATGQQIDLDSFGIQFAQCLGLVEQFKARTVHDDGIKFVRADDTVVAKFPVGTGAAGVEFVKDIEILRGDMVDVLYKATVKEGVEYVFGDYITGLQEDEAAMNVTFAKGKQREFDVVVIADGLYSKTRTLAFGPDSAHINSLRQVTAIFSIPWDKADGSWSCWCNDVGGRVLSIRPQADRGICGAYLGICTKEAEEAHALATLSVEEQKKEWARRFGNAKWRRTQRIIDAMQKADDFYVFETAQVKAPHLAKGRVALLGDAGYCPSPLSGQGTTLAFSGAYVLAGCICSNEDVKTGLKEYERLIRPIAENRQTLIPGVPHIACPRTPFGVWILEIVLWVVSGVINSGLVGILGRVFGPAAKVLSSEPVLPDFPAMRCGEKEV
jgi:2-polyprenyl-6-methoxyphenol hydroxylase-like FAD-dependent oxidoreductase